MAAQTEAPAHIDAKDPQDVARWAKELGISAEQLEAIMKIVGNSVSAVQAEIATE